MAGFLRFVALFAVLVGFLVLVALPLALGPLLTQTVRDMGLRSQTLQVTVAMFDPLLVLGQSRSMHLSASSVDLHPAGIGDLELTLGGVSIFDRTWSTIDGRLSNLSVTTGGQQINLDSLTVSGPAGSADATARLTAAETEALIRFAAQREGLQLDSVQMGASGVTVKIHGVQGTAQLEVRGGALVLLAGSGNGGVPLIQPAPSDPWQLNEAWISDSGLNVRGTVDTTRLAAEVTGRSN